MSVLDSFFNKGGFKAAKCKTLLKLTIPRIKLLRNRREIQIKQMRRDIAKLLETGQEATARIRVEHIIREEKMMAAQEIIELFSELVAVRLPIIEAQRECPLDLKEAISSICFAAPRCADLPELLQVQMLFVGKYGKEFVAAATELMPECGVNRQLVELLSVRAPAPDVKLKLLKDIAEEHELDWDPAASETELLKPHEDLLNGPTQFVSGSKLPLPKEKHDEVLYSASTQAPTEPSNSDAGFDTSDFPEVPKASLRPNAGSGSAPEMLPFPASALSGFDPESPNSSGDDESDEVHMEPDKILHERLAKEFELPNAKVSPTEDKQFSNAKVSPTEDKQFSPFVTPSALAPPSVSFSASQSNLPPPRTKSDLNVDLQEVLAAANAAAESAERAAAAARSAASLAQITITELVKNRKEEAPGITGENPFHDTRHSYTPQQPGLDHENSFTDSDVSSSPKSNIVHEQAGLQSSNPYSYDGLNKKYDTTSSEDQLTGQSTFQRQPQRLDSMDDETYLSFPNLFSHGSNPVSRAQSFADKTHPPNDL